MKIIRCIAVLLTIIFVPYHAAAAEKSPSQYEIPDLLDEGFDEYDEDEGWENLEEYTVSDPLEPINRVFFELNDTLYDWVLKPITDGYIWLIPLELRECADNFFRNLSAPVRVVNSVLQGELKQSGVVLERFLINTTLGVYGLVDVASTEFEIQAKRADFGQTLGRWGLGTGIYICWPVIGPSTMRDTVGLVVDTYTHPIPYFHENRTLDIAYYASHRINTLSFRYDVYEDMRRYSLDPYIASRQAYYEYRQALVESGTVQ